MTERSELQFHRDKESGLYVPDVDTRIVRIEHLATSPEGFQLETVRNTPGDTGGKPMDWFFDEENRHHQEVKVSHISNRLDVKLGTRAVLREGNVLKLDLIRALYFQYKDPELARDPEIPKPFGTALALFTTEEDGSRRLIVQHRGENNFFYGDIPGASVAGMWTGTWKIVDGNLIQVDSVDTDSAKTNIYREAHEENALVPSDFSKLVITGYCKDKVKDHPELTFEGITELSANELIERAEQARRAGKYRTTHQFGERLVAIPGTRDGIDRLLTQVRSPLPPTHVAAYIAGYNGLLLEEIASGALTAEQAQGELDSLSGRVDENYAHIDDLVAFYYRKHPEELDNIGFREDQPRDAKGYAPAYFPKHQGLPHAIDELVRTELITPSIAA